MFRRVLAVPALMGLLALGACDQAESLVSPSSGGLTIKLTDAPGDFSEARVKIEQIYLQGDGDNGRVTLYEGGTEYVDLLTLAGGKTIDLVKDAVVPAGSYSELRFVICDAYVKTKDGKVYASQGASLPDDVTADGKLQMPSFCQSGLKVKLPGGSIAMDDEAKVLVVDFDVSQSFGKAAGKSGMWVMHPVVHATDFSASGTIAGLVVLNSDATVPATCGEETFGSAEGQVALVSKFVPRVQDGEDLRSGLTDATGAHKIHFVAPGSYSPTFAAAIGYSNGDTLTFEATAAPTPIQVESGKTAKVDYAVSGAACKVAAATTTGGTSN